MYYFVPIMLKKPIWSHGLSLVGFWGLAFFYPLNGIHHFLYTPIPMFLQYGAVIATVAVELVVTTVIINFFGTIWGVGRQAMSNLPIRWFYTGMVLYFVTCLQCALQVTFTFQALIHFSDWVVGHAHLVMFGVFTLWLMGIMTYLFPRLLHKPLVQPDAMRMALLAVGGRHRADVWRSGAARAFCKVIGGARFSRGTFRSMGLARFGFSAFSPGWRFSPDSCASSTTSIEPGPVRRLP